MQFISRAAIALGLVASAGIAGASGVSAAAKTTGTFHVWVALAPAVIPYNSTAVLGVMTAPGALCTPRVTYANGKVPATFAQYVTKKFKVPAHGVLRWTWHEMSTLTKSSKAGKAAVTCIYHGVTVTSSIPFNLTSLNA